jgi:hypothetical protein
MLCLVETCLIVLAGLYVPIHPGYVARMDAPALAFAAHNTRAGALFLELQPGSRISYTDDLYTVTELVYMQALEPMDPTGDLIDEAGTRRTAGETWDYIYNRPGALVLQTCVERDGLTEWGRLFVIAEPE